MKLVEKSKTDVCLSDFRAPRKSLTTGTAKIQKTLAEVSDGAPYSGGAVFGQVRHSYNINCILPAI